MIAKLNSDKAVLVDTFNNITAKPKVEIANLIIDSNGYIVNGHYFYEVIENEGTPSEVVVKKTIANISSHYTLAEITTLCTALNAPNVTAIVLGTLQGALKHIVVSDGKWGLTANNWK